MARFDINRLKITEPTSAYEVLNRVIQLTLDEPKRMRMGMWFDDNLDWLPQNKQPACGTVGCIAGWTRFITGCEGDYRGVANVLFSPSTEGHKELKIGFTSGEHFMLPDGTQDQAEAVARFLRGIQLKYRSELKRRTIQPPAAKRRRRTK